LINKIRTGLAATFDSSIEKPDNEAAVLIAITDDPSDPAMVLTRRASHMNSHAGEVAFPGGKVDATDRDLVVTALRESFEEIGLAQNKVDVVGALSASTSKFGLQVRPIVGIIPADIELVGSEDELDSIFHVPLRFFFENEPAVDYEVRFNDVDYVVPCYRYEGYVIWGLTAYFIGDFLNQVFDLDVDLSMTRGQFKKKS